MEICRGVCTVGDYGMNYEYNIKDKKRVKALYNTSYIASANLHAPILNKLGTCVVITNIIICAKLF